MTSVNEYRYLWGVLLEEIVSRWGVADDKKDEAKKELYRAFKEYVDLDSLTSLETYDAERFLGMIRMLMAREKAMVLKEPNENLDIENIGMRLFLKHKLHEEKL
jgi:ABC-type cobalamin/Fe3+-siderophores transport system ATPase subunit